MLSWVVASNQRLDLANSRSNHIQRLESVVDLAKVVSAEIGEVGWSVWQSRHKITVQHFKATVRSNYANLRAYRRERRDYARHREQFIRLNLKDLSALQTPEPRTGQLEGQHVRRRALY